jgi:hypothetical protein
MKAYEIFLEDKNKFIIEHLYADVSDTTMIVYIQSGFFAGIGTLCFDNQMAESVVNDLQHMYKTLSGETKVIDFVLDSYINIRMLNHGKLIVSGKIIDFYSRDHSMTFSYEADQTLLKNLIDSFHKSLWFALERL